MRGRRPAHDHETAGATADARWRWRAVGMLRTVEEAPKKRDGVDVSVRAHWIERIGRGVWDLGMAKHPMAAVASGQRGGHEAERMRREPKAANDLTRPRRTGAAAGPRARVFDRQLRRRGHGRSPVAWCWKLKHCPGIARVVYMDYLANILGMYRDTLACVWTSSDLCTDSIQLILAGVWVVSDHGLAGGFDHVDLHLSI